MFPSPRKLTRLAGVVAVLSIITGLVFLFWQPGPVWAGTLPALGLVLSVVLLALALVRGWVLSMQERARLSESINMCSVGMRDDGDGKAHSVNPGSVN